jgi:predicted phosphodiesterase
MKIVVLSDIHANQFALEAICEDYKDETVDEVWFLGDLYGYGPFTTQVYAKLKIEIQPKVWLAGNHDLAVSGELRCLVKMNDLAKEAARIHREITPSKMLAEVAGQVTQETRRTEALEFHLAHGFPAQDRFDSANIYDYERAPHSERGNLRPLRSHERAEFPNSKVWLVGHSHRQTGWRWDGTLWSQLVEGFGQTLAGENVLYSPEFDEGKSGEHGPEFEINFEVIDPESFVILNPGSVGFPRDGACNLKSGDHVAKYLYLEVEGTTLRGEFRRVRYSAQPLIDAWKNANYPDGLEHFLKC